MGRRAKYTTLEEKQAAKRQQQRFYSRSERGKATRKVQNACTYAKRCGRQYASQPSSPSATPQHTASEAASVSLPCFPSTLIALARAPYPDTHLFHEALRSADAVDESDLSQWDADPPYHYPVPLDTPAEARFTANIVDVMHGRRLRQERCARMDRAKVWGEEGKAQLCAILKDEIIKQFAQWEALEAKINELDKSVCERHMVMARHLLQWKARALYCRRQEFSFIQMNIDPYIQHM
ncbi:hypothetical protein BJ138DRAFT_1168197 [Hygrophoropsis aurantiaca]|uniref:Uncharacterized protein n=1 Tax=Hygrophoropsis aurantiaca TaxID=72124 RepID=A0ACB7ZR62_9AGAM|nr:hypothetical protein BJ138DRAFT_1168197 [Hygrophoropsis aurantiaca]